MQIITEFRVVGRPAPQGSKKPTGNGGFMEASKYVDAWRNDVRAAAMAHFGEALIDGPVFTMLAFLFNRPKCHYVSSNTDKPLKADAPFWHTSSPDIDKLERATNDAMTGVIWVDDRQVAGTLSQKFYIPHHESQGAIIRICRLTETMPVSLTNV